MIARNGNLDYDVAVIGGGPAGSSAAIGLALAGRRVLVLERDKFPRFHIGESLLPMSNHVFHQLQLDEAIAGLDPVEKWGASFITADGSHDSYADFTQAYNVLEARAYQVVRSQFDEMLLRQAQKRGADVREGVSVEDVKFHGDHVEVTFGATGAAGERETVKVGAIADASGRRGFMASRLNLRTIDPELKKLSVFSHFLNVPRPEGRRYGDIRLISREDMGWFWFIPVTRELMSVGIVTSADKHRARLDAMKGQPLEAVFDSYVKETPVAAELLKNAERTMPYRTENDFSYWTTTYFGDRFVLVGDAGSFLDPIFSTGVHLALKAGLEASRALDAALGKDGGWRERPLAKYQQTQVRRYRHFRKFVLGFYQPEFRDLFFRPNRSHSMFRSVTTVLAGHDRPSLRTRFFNALFFRLVRIQRYYPLVPRLHPQPARA